MIRGYWDLFRYWLYRNIDELDESSLKHRSSIMFLSLILLFIDPGINLTFGSASLAGLGISVDPAQTLPISILLLSVLVYRLIAFWVSALLKVGCDIDRAIYKAEYDFDSSFEAEEPRLYDKEYIIRSKSNEIVYKWKVRKILWQFAFPNFLALLSIIFHLVKFV